MDKIDTRTSRRLRLERKLAGLRHKAGRLRRQAEMMSPIVRTAFERRACELELQAFALQARFGDSCGLPLAAPVQLRPAA
ncbi:MAG: hypothetical protein EDR02_06030 [Actinobacteria bacterium]|nr:MAG: hypothetical protein EDR02_06030 [Actinomycetota bacterium]RIK08198.1 MAG: hypothetical protein DCC48_02150 [Acidobacteriota bacterium]